MSKVLFVVLLMQLASFEVVGVAGYTLKISPPTMHVTQAPNIVTFTCTSNLAIAGCQFKWWDDYNSAGPLLELSGGIHAQANPAHLDTNNLTGYSYSGGGLEAGDCGISLQVTGWKNWMVACRVRVKTGAWKYAWADLYAADWTPISHTLTPREAVVLPGGEARFLLKANEPLERCYFRLPGVAYKIFFHEGAASALSFGRHFYLGAGLQSGECGLRLTDVNEGPEADWPLRCLIDTPKSKYKVDWRYMVLIVADRPTPPTLSLTYTLTDVTATCEVLKSRPVASLSWLLGDNLIRQDDIDDTVCGTRDEWRWPWMHGSIQQTLTLQLKPQYNGKLLTCRVSHVTLGQAMEVTETVSFTAMCPPLESPIVDFTCNFAGDLTECNQWHRIASRSEFKCKTGYVIADHVTFNSLNCRSSGQWDEYANLCKPATCPPITSETVAYKCFFAEHVSDCSESQKVGTRAEFVCKPGFVAAAGIFSSTNCNGTGMWNPEIVTCSPDCGRQNTNHGETLISGGAPAQIGEFPWHVAIYEEKSSGSYEYICGGSLISTKTVISAAHCFWNVQKNKKKNSTYHVAAGKLKQMWSDELEEERVQRREVKTTIIHPHYHGRSTQFQCDIALVKLQDDVMVTPNVNIICIDVGNKFEHSQLVAGNNGTVTGWGFTQERALSEDLKKVELPYVDHQTCYDALRPELRSLFSSNKFCAGYIDQSISTCTGDSGGGLVFLLKPTDKFYLRGIVSINFKPYGIIDRCYSQFYVCFTQVSRFIPWIQVNAN